MLIKELCDVQKITINPQKQENVLFTHYSLPSFDNNKTPDIVYGKEILSSKYVVPKNVILYNKLNLRFKRIWNIKNNTKINCICSGEFIPLVIKNNIILQDYLYYYLLTDKLNKKLLETAHGTSSSHQRIDINDLLNYEIKVPSMEEQLHIVDTIGSIDDLIENNNTIIIKLENIILNLYRKKSIEWKKQVKIGDLFKCILGGTPSTKKNEYWDGDIAWVNSGEVNKLRIVSPSRYITKDGLENSATKLLPKKTTVIAITGATLGQVSLLEIDSCTNQSVIGILENNTLKHDFIYPMMINAIKKLVLNKTGGAQQHINKNDVETFEIFVPSEIEYFEYSQIVQPIFEYQSKLILQNKELLLLK